jgi:hypothetical protein
MPALTEDELYAELATSTQMSDKLWRDIVSLPTYQFQVDALTAYKDASWTKSSSTLAHVLEVLTVLGTIAGAVSGVAGAATAVVALKAVL